MKPIILFDLDGTLIDSTEAILESFHYALDQFGSIDYVSDEMITSQIGHPLEVMFAEVGVRSTFIDSHVQTYKNYYRNIACAKTILLPGAKEAINEASKFAQLGIVTTKTALYSKELMEYFGVMHYFKTLIGREHVIHPKPHPEPILKALEAFESKSDVYMIGDTRLDLEASIRAGVIGVGVLSGYDNFEELSLLSDIIKKDVLEAVEYIGRIGTK